VATPATNVVANSNGVTASPNAVVAPPGGVSQVPPVTTPIGPPENPVTISGVITFDRVPINPFTNGLDYDNTFQSPARNVVVEAVTSGGTVAASTTDENGAYSLQVEAQTSVRIRARSRMRQTTGVIFDFEVLDNTSNDAPYILAGSFSDSGVVDSTRNLNAPSGWNGSQYTSTRAAAPFAILDTIFEAVTDFTAVDPAITYPRLRVFWSELNTTANGTFANGDIGTSFFSRDAGGPFLAILGAENNDTDEYDTHVIIHEFGHYFEDQLSRSDSIGGVHDDTVALDLRVAFSEGFANALSGVILDDSVYRDTFGPAQAAGFSFDNESNSVAPEGWFNEGSVGSIVYDIFDDDDDGPDTVSVGLGPLYRAMTSDQYRTTPEATSIFAFIEALLLQPEVDLADIVPLLTEQTISAIQSDAVGETNNGGITTSLPVFRGGTFGGSPVTVCSTDDEGLQNRLGTYAFVQFSLASNQTVTITANRISGQSPSDPEIELFREGASVGFSFSTTTDSESLTRNLEAGDYLIAITDFNNLDAAGIDVCFDVRIQ